MPKKVACKKCKFLFEGGDCPNCHEGQTVPNWKGRLYILNPEKSEIAKKVGNENKGEYAIKVS